MATFYLLPPRPMLAERLSGYLQNVFPGFDWDRGTQDDLADSLSALIQRRADLFVVFREDLPTGEQPARALANGFGAEIGDEVVEVRAGGANEMQARRWRIEANMIGR